MADTTLYLYTSLTAGSSHIITATSRLETILKANKIPFRAIDTATDEKARTLWSRRSKGRKIPGLVKHGIVIGDLEQIEEWNEFGELEEQVDNVSDVFGDTPMTDTPMAPPVNTLPPNPLKPIVEYPADKSLPKAGSESKHISISEPKDNKAKAASSDPTASLKANESPLALAMRQAGAEAAARAGAKKTAALKTSATTNVPAAASTPADSAAAATSTAAPSSPIGTITTKRDTTDTTPNPATILASAEATEPGDDPSVTAAKHPSQLAAEGVRKSTADAAEGHSDSSTATSASISAEPSGAPTKVDPEGGDVEAEPRKMSTEEQVLEQQRRGSIAKVSSRLAEGTSVDDVDDDGNEKSSIRKQVEEAQANVAADEKTPSLVKENSQAMESSDMVATRQESAPSIHRGSELQEADEETVKAIEQQNRIEEDPTENDHANDVEGKAAVSEKVETADQHEHAATKGTAPGETNAAEGEDAGKSVGD